METALPPERLAAVAFKSNLVFWLLTTYSRSSLISIMGVPKGFELTPEYKADVAEVMETVLSVNPRSEGAVFDMFVSNADIDTGNALEEIAAPVLIAGPVNDPLTVYVNARAMAETIPETRLVTIESGGHMLLGHQEKVRSEIGAFLAEFSSGKKR